MNTLKMHCIAALLISLMASAACAQEVQFTVKPDKTQMGQDESLSLRFEVKADGANWSASNPSFNAPDFDAVHEFSNVFIESFYENGRFGVRQNRQFTQVFRPRKMGTLKIDGLEVKVGGKVYQAPPITVNVVGGGAATPPPAQYGGAGGGLRGAGKRGSSLPFFVRAEINKTRLYKGEQAVVSYYLYRRSRVMNIQVNKYPTLNGFLREELEMPIQSGRLDTEQVALDGVAYDRSLLVRYAAYPLKEGRLQLDPLGVQGNYFSASDSIDEDDDPFQSFFRQMGPKSYDSRSETVNIEVLPLPTAGRPTDFSGAVGSFTVTGALDKYEVKAGEPITLTVKVEGQGNLASVTEPKVVWPASIDLFESKGRTSSGRGGMGVKIFEFLLIPREGGQLTLPSIPINFFDPATKEYVVKQTEPFTVRVTAGDPSVIRSKPKAVPMAPGSLEPAPALSESEDQSLVPKALREGWNRRIRDQRTGLIAAIATLFLSLVAFMFWIFRLFRRKRSRPDLADEESALKWRQIEMLSKQDPQISDANLTQVYELLTGIIYDALEHHFEISARAYSRSDLEQMLLAEKHMNVEQWRRCAKLLEYAEQVRFAGSLGGLGEARQKLTSWVNEARLIESELGRL